MLVAKIGFKKKNWTYQTAIVNDVSDLEDIVLQLLLIDDVKAINIKKMGVDAGGAELSGNME